MCAAINRAALLNSMPQDATGAMRAGRRHGVNGAFEAVEGQCPALLRDLKRFVVIIAAYVTLRHDFFLVDRGAGTFRRRVGNG